MFDAAPRTDLLQCPRCRAGSLTIVPNGEERQVRCLACASVYPLRDGVIDLLPDLAHTRSLAQRAMESDTIVRIYESRLWRRSLIATLALGLSFAREQEMVLAATSARRGGTVLDLACGPGIYTRPLARRVGDGSVIGIDLSLPMLRYARRRAREEQLDNITLLRASALALPLRAGQLDAVVCCGALHLFPDVAQALREIGRVLEPRGRFTTAVFRQPGGRVGEAVSLGRAFGLHAFRTNELERLLEDAGFEAITELHRSCRWLLLSSHTAAERR